jgi:gluconokinase
MIVVLMGVSGSGKSTIGKLLADQLGWTLVEADDYHPQANIDKMRGGTPLSDEDRRPWLAALRKVIDQACERDEDVVIACSALKHDYREYLAHHAHRCVKFVYLSGSEELIQERLEHRKGHFMNPSLLHSQFGTLEPPADAIKVDVAPPPQKVADEIRFQLGL